MRQPISDRDAGAFLQVHGLVKHFGNICALDDLSFSVARGECLTLLGPSGCGKTTMLRCIAGFEYPDSGRIEIDGQRVCDAERGVHVRPERRQFGMVFQSYAVWPHMTVEQNVAYGLRNRGVAKADISERVSEVLRMVGLEGREGHNVTVLSGGQQQRVALARALVYRPKVLLFDEPLSNLDAKLRERMRLELRRLQAELGITSIYVTHDQEEAMVVSDRVIVMESGRIRQIGTPQDIYDRPVSRYVAQFIGSANIFPARVMQVDEGGRHVAVKAEVGDSMLQLRAVYHQEQPPQEGGDGFVCIRNESISVVEAGVSQGEGRNAIKGVVRRRISMGSYMEYVVLANGHEIIVRAPRAVSIAENSAADLSFAEENCLYLAD